MFGSIESNSYEGNFFRVWCLDCLFYQNSENGLIIWRMSMSSPHKDKDRKQEKLPIHKEVKDDIENKPSRLAERKGQRPAFPFRRKPV